MRRRATRAGLSAVLAFAAAVGLVTSYVGSRPALPLVAVAVVSVAVAVFIATQVGVGHLAVTMLCASAFLTPMNRFRLNQFMNASDAFLLAAAALIIADRLARKSAGPPWRCRPALTSLVLVILGGLVATAFSRDLAGLSGLIRFALSTVGVISVVAVWRPSTSQVRLLVAAYVAGAACSAIFAVVEGPTGFAGRPIGLANHPNHLGITSMLGAAGAMGLASGTHAQRALVGITAYGVLALGVVVSGSRAALGALLASFLLFSALMRNWRVLRVVAAVSVFASLAAVLGVVHLPGDNSIDRLWGEDPRTQASNAERRAALDEGVGRIRESPITGSGFQHARAAHSFYIQMWVAAGLLGLAGFARLTVVVARLLARPPSRDPLFVAMMAGFVGVLIAGLVSASIWDRFIWLYLALAFALIPVASTSPAPGGPTHAPAPARS